MNLQNKREQKDTMQVKKKGVALKGTQESSTEDSTNEDDKELDLVIKKANKIMKGSSIRRKDSSS